MFNETPIDFTASTTNSSRLFLTCNEECGLGVAPFTRVIQAIRLRLYPIGTVVDYFAPLATLIDNSFIPEGWAVCDGSEYSTELHSDLFNILGSPNLPNFDERISVMQDDVVLGLLSDLTPQTGQTRPTTIGEEFGANNQRMQGFQIPIHSHRYIDTRIFGVPNTLASGDDNSARPVRPIEVFNQTTNRTSDQDGFELPSDLMLNEQPTIVVIKIIKLS